MREREGGSREKGKGGGGDEGRGKEREGGGRERGEEKGEVKGEGESGRGGKNNRENKKYVYILSMLQLYTTSPMQTTLTLTGRLSHTP